MKFKLDGNFGTRTQELFKSAGYDVKTVLEQNMQGCSDQHIYDACCAEKRCLVTLDLDFADVIRFPPTKSSGIAIIRIRQNTTITILEKLIQQFLVTINQRSIESELRIVEFGKIRIHQNK